MADEPSPKEVLQGATRSAADVEQTLDRMVEQSAAKVMDTWSFRGDGAYDFAATQTPEGYQAAKDAVRSFQDGVLEKRGISADGASNEQARLRAGYFGFSEGQAADSMQANGRDFSAAQLTQSVQAGLNAAKGVVRSDLVGGAIGQVGVDEAISAFGLKGRVNVDQLKDNPALLQQLGTIGAYDKGGISDQVLKQANVYTGPRA